MSRFLRENRTKNYRGARPQTNFSRGMRGRGRGKGPLQGRGGKLLIEPHRHPGIYIAKSKEDMLVTKNMVPGIKFMISI